MDGTAALLFCSGLFLLLSSFLDTVEMKHTLLSLTYSYRLSFFFRLFFLRFRERLLLSDDEDEEDESLELVSPWSLSLSSEELLLSRCLFFDFFCFFELDLDLEDILLE